MNPTAASLLGFLQFGPRTGWQVTEIAQLCLGEFWNLTRSQVYRELRALADRGLVTVGEKGARDATPYAITDAGRRAFEDWLQLEPAPDTMRSPFAVKMFFSEQLSPETRRRFVQLEQRRNDERLAFYRQLETATAELTNFAPLLLQFGIGYRELAASWLRDVEARLGSDETT